MERMREDWKQYSYPAPSLLLLWRKKAPNFGVVRQSNFATYTTEIVLKRIFLQETLLLRNLKRLVVEFLSHMQVVLF